MNIVKMSDDIGYVRLVDTFGDDLRVINAARASYNKESLDWSERDEKLLKYLWTNGHKSVFRHCALTFEINAPIMVKNQWIKYAVASSHLDDQYGWNEMSRRYVTEEPEFYIPTEWRGKPANSKQGSDGISEFSDQYEDLLKDHVYQSVRLYEEALADGICAEQARLFLPAFALYTKWYWTCSLASFMHFLTERLDEHAQFEIREFAKAAKELAIVKFSKSLELL